MRPFRKITGGTAAYRALMLVLCMAALGLTAQSCGNGTGGGIPLPFLKSTQAASVVIGQADMYNGLDNRGGAPSKYTLSSPWGNPTIINGALFLPDSGNNRIMAYNAVPAVNNTPADFVLGQPDFTSTGKALAHGALNSPSDVLGTEGMLIAVDSWNNRLLIWDPAPSSTGALPDVVVGQADFTTAETGCSGKRVMDVEGAFAVNGVLMVADMNNNRTLIWNSVPTANDTPADLVLGQADFLSCQPNRGEADASAYTMHKPGGVWSDGERLVVADTGNNRLLIWNTFPALSNTPADLVVGQPDFSTTSPGLWDIYLQEPVRVHSNGAQLFSAGCDGNRVMVWNPMPVMNTAPAWVVLGQPDFESDLPNNGMGTPGPRYMDCPGGLFAHKKIVIVGEWGNSRYTIFRGH